MNGCRTEQTQRAFIIFVVLCLSTTNACEPIIPIAADAGPTPLLCEWQDASEPNFLTHLGCPEDFLLLAATPLDSSLTGAQTLKFVIDRASIAEASDCESECQIPTLCAKDDNASTCMPYNLYFQNTKQRSLHFYFARDFLSGLCQCKQGCVESCDCDTDDTCSDGCRCDTDCECNCADLPRACSLPMVSDMNAFNSTEYILPTRRFLLGSITFFASADIYALNLAPIDTANAEMITHMFRRIQRDSFFGAKLVFLPGSSSQERLGATLPTDIRVVTTAQLYAGIDYQALNIGETVGQVRILRANELDSTYVSPRDLVVLDAVPNDITPVAGIITAQFQTPLSHVNVLSQNRGTPNMALRNATNNAAIRAVNGQWARLRVGANEWSIEAVSADEADAWWLAHRPDPLTVPDIDINYAQLAAMSVVDVDDINRVGAKAANFGSLSRVAFNAKRFNFERSDELNLVPKTWIADSGTWLVIEAPSATSSHVLSHQASSGLVDAVFAPQKWRNFTCSTLITAPTHISAGIALLRSSPHSYFSVHRDGPRLILMQVRAAKVERLASAVLATADETLKLVVSVHDGLLRASAFNGEDEELATLDYILGSQMPGLSCGASSTASEPVAFDDFEIKPQYVPRGFAIPFFYFLHFMQDNGFYQQLDLMLANEQFRQNGDVRRESLAALRERMLQAPVDPAFINRLENKIALEYPQTRLRFRSSTNAEDLGNYSGAGLYTSTSGALDDPERPVVNAVRTVWASLFNQRAFEERELLSVDHHDVAMAILVHRSFADERANGVAITTNIFDETEQAFFINLQHGEASVTNPRPGELPDQLLYYWAGLTPATVYLSYSTLAGGVPVMTPREIHELASAMLAIHRHFQSHFGTRPGYAMELELKLDNPDRSLVIKQARPYPGRGEL